MIIFFSVWCMLLLFFLLLVVFFFFSYLFLFFFFFFFSSRRRHTRFDCDWSSDVCSSDLVITAAIIEVARNVLTFGERGDLMLHLIQRRGRLGLAIVARDKGPGLSDVRQALRDSLGLASARRLMDEFRIRSEPGRGTVITMRKWTRCRQVERAGARRLGHAGLRKAR